MLPTVHLPKPGTTADFRALPQNYGKFEMNNTYAAKEKMPPESHQRRMQGLFKAWETRQRRQNGEFSVHVRKINARTRRKRTRLRLTVAKEQREIQDICRTHAVAAIEALADIVDSNTTQDSVRVAAISVLLDRAYGKASQTNINANVDANGPTNEITSKELDARVARAVQRIEAITGGEAKAPKSEKQPPDVRIRDRNSRRPKSLH